MITATLKTWLQTVRALLTNMLALAMFVALDALLLGSFYIFISTREATVWQVLVTYVFLILLPLEFFLLQATILDAAHGRRFHWKRIVLNAIKIAVVTIPVLLVAWGLWYLLNKLQARFPAPSVPITFGATSPKPQPIHWPTLLFSTLRFLLFGVALPLAAIRLWIEVTAGEVRALFTGGAKAVLNRLGNTLGRAFATDAVLIYGIGLILVVLLPYLILLLKLSVKGNKTEFIIFIGQLLIAFVVALCGWIVTVSALARLDNRISIATVSPAPAAPVAATA